MTSPANKSALLLFAHGSSDPGWAGPFIRLKAAVEAREHNHASNRKVELAFLERMVPSFDQAVDALHRQGIRHITVAPIFLAVGGHMRKELPELVGAAQARTGIEFRVLPALGEVDALIDSIAAWVLNASR